MTRFLAVLLVVAGCGGEAPEGLLLELSASPVPLDEVIVSVVGAQGLLVRDQKFPARLPGRIQLDGHGRTERVRALVWGASGGTRVAFGWAEVDVAPGARKIIPIELLAPPPTDVDADGVPDPADAHFDTVPAGTAFSDDHACDTLVRRADFEPRAENASANATVPTSLMLPDWSGDQHVNTRIKPRISGQFTGTTDEILQWAACRWGIDEDLLRAWAVTASDWRQPLVNGGSYGLFQIAPQFSGGTLPWAQTSTAFNADYLTGWWRACYEGYWTWIEGPQPNSGYAPGDAYGCIGMWYSGRWHDSDADMDIARVKAALQARGWEKPTF